VTVSRTRQESVHTRGSQIDDSRDPPDHDVSAEDLADTLDFYASQFRKITGKANWETAPAKTIEEIVATGLAVDIKSGVLIPGAFAGNPKKATVTFTTAFPDANYAVTLAAEAANDKGFVPHVESKTAAGFVVNLGTNNIANLVAVGWHATPNGEF
jgi:hypothetical protein